MSAEKFYLPLLSVLVALSVISCTGKQSHPVSGGAADSVALQERKPQPVATDRILLDTTATVQGYETQKYPLTVATDGNYSFVVTSGNTGMVFVIQDAAGNNVIDETSSSWSGELKKGQYTLIVGLTRNAARKNEGKQAQFSVLVKQAGKE